MEPLWGSHRSCTVVRFLAYFGCQFGGPRRTIHVWCGVATPASPRSAPSQLPILARDSATRDYSLNSLLPFVRSNFLRASSISRVIVLKILSTSACVYS